MLIAAEGQLVSVSHIASDPRSSAMVAQASLYPANSGRAEEIFVLEPDLVLAGTFTARASVDMLTRLGIEVVTFAPADSLADVRDNLIRMGAALGHPERAEVMAANFDARLAAYLREVTLRPRAALYYANGYTSGDRTLAGQILDAAGFDNIAEQAGFDGGGVIPLEVLAMARPDTVITSQPYPAASRSEEVMGHPVIESLRARLPAAGLTDSDWVCGTPFVLQAIAEMAALRTEVLRP
jgi:iron complex transport system substrate-binding protein